MQHTYLLVCRKVGRAIFNPAVGGLPLCPRVGARTPEGKAILARNGYNGAQRRRMPNMQGSLSGQTRYHAIN